MAKKGQTFTKYSPNFKLSVIPDVRKNNLGYGEVVRKYWNLDSYKESDHHRSQVRLWERIFLKEGAKGFMVARRGRKSKGRPKKKSLPTELQQDIITELRQLRERNEYLEMENEYLKKSDALIRAEEQKKK